MTTGCYLGVTADGELALIPRGRADVDTTAFYLLKSKVRQTNATAGIIIQVCSVLRFLIIHKKSIAFLCATSKLEKNKVS